MTTTTIPFDSVEGRARYIDQAILYVDSREVWKVGDFGQTISSYRAITYQGTALTDAIGAVALAVNPNAGGGYTLYAASSHGAGAREFYSASIAADGRLIGANVLSDSELIVVEHALGIDLNGNGGIGAASVLYADSIGLDVMVDPSGVLFIDNGLGTRVPLYFGGAAVTADMVGEALDITDVLATTQGFQAFVADTGGNVFQVDFGAGGHSTHVQLLTPEQVRAAEAARNVDLNNRTDTPLTDGWTAMLQTASVRQLVEHYSADGRKLTHADLVHVVAAALTSVPAGQPVGEALVGDLRAIAARGQALLGGDAAGTDYLSFVFDKMVGASMANNFYTGGATRSQPLGSLSESSSAEQLYKLAAKWLLGLDLPNPTTQGDSANPDAYAATGVYKLFDAPLFGSDGPQFTDVNQGSAGTCYLMASAAAVAHSRPGAIEAIFVDNGRSDATGQQTYGVRLYDARGQTHWVTVNNQLAVESADDTAPMYSKLSNALTPQTSKMWLPLLEKAYAQMNEQGILAREAASNGKNAMWAIEGGMSESGSYILGSASWIYTDEVSTPEVINGNPLVMARPLPDGLSELQALSQYVNGGGALWVGSDVTTRDAQQRVLFTGGHAFMALDADPANPGNTTVTVYNPWGSTLPGDARYVAPFTADLAQLVGTEGLDFWMYQF